MIFSPPPIIYELQEQAAAFEAAVFGTCALWNHYDPHYPPADFHCPVIQVTNFSSDSLAVAMKMRLYGYQLLEKLEGEWRARMERAIEALIEYESIVSQTNQHLYGDLYFRNEALQPGKK